MNWLPLRPVRGHWFHTVHVESEGGGWEMVEFVKVPTRCECV